MRHRLALHDPRGYADTRIELLPGVAAHWANVANGDARTALSALELAVGQYAAGCRRRDPHYA